MARSENSLERRQPATAPVGKSRKTLAVALLGLGLIGTGYKLMSDAVDYDRQADAANRSGQVNEAYAARSIEADKLAIGGPLTAIGGLVLMAAVGYWGGASAQRQRQQRADATSQPPVANRQLYDGPDTTTHAEPPAPLAQARVEVPLTPPLPSLEWQPPQVDPHVAYRRPQ